MSTVDTKLCLWLREGKPYLRCSTKDYSEARRAGLILEGCSQLCTSAVRIMDFVPHLSKHLVN